VTAATALRRARGALAGDPSAGSRTGRRLGLVGAGLLIGVTLLAVFAPLLAGHDPSAPSGAPYAAPSAEFPLGTNDIGQDLFAQLVYGARVSLAIGVLSAVLATAIGLGVALLAGSVRGRTEALLMRVVDLALAFPFFVLVIVLAAFLGRDLLITTAVISAVLWAKPARVLYSDVLKVGEFQHVVAARAMGASPLRVLGRHVLPRLAPLGVSQFVRTANVAVFLESALAFLGLGDPNRVSWGSMLFFASSRSAFLTDAWLWWILPPGLALTAVLVGFAFLGYAIEERADPRLSGRRLPGAGRRPAPRPAGEAPAPQAAGTVLEVRDLSVAYRSGAREVRAVDGIGIAVPQRGVVGLVGESGSGKSSVALALLGLLRPPGRVLGGEILLNGRDLRSLRGPEARGIRGREVALVPQGAMSSLNPAYTIRRQVVESAALTRDDPGAAAKRAREVLDAVGIAAARHGAFPHELSGGMRQRVVIAMAVANEPSLVVADEPVTGLDVVTQARILALLLELRDRLGMALVLISHDLRLVGRVADQLLVMQGGRVVEAAAAETVMTSPRHPHTKALLAASPALREVERPR
jgi:peptide/nickel transport system ATP-binding protein